MSVTIKVGKHTLTIPKNEAFKLSHLLFLANIRNPAKEVAGLIGTAAAEQGLVFADSIGKARMGVIFSKDDKVLDIKCDKENIGYVVGKGGSNIKEFVTEYKVGKVTLVEK